MKKRERKKYVKRVKVLFLIFILSFVILLFRSFWLQVVKGERYHSLSLNHTLRLVPLPPLRGLIFDREGKILAENVPSFTLAAVPSNLEDREKFFSTLKRNFGLKKKEVEEKLKKASSPLRPVTLKTRITLPEAIRVLENYREFPGMTILTQPVRFYPQEKIASHLLGYLGEATRREIESGWKIERGDWIGKAGVEKSYNRWLQGEKGAKFVEVDAYGRPLKYLEEKKPIPGYNLWLTLELEMQKISEEELGERKGVVILMDSHTGEILSMVSHPSYNPNRFTKRLSKKEWEKLKTHPLNPFQNRALSGMYPPASTFKLVLLIAGLKEGIINENTRFFCTGSYPVGKRIFKCWKEEGHGEIGVIKAVAQSCNSFFYWLGLKLGVEKIAKYARMFGLGNPTGIDLPFEERGLVPTPRWKLKKTGLPWYEGDTANLSIGEGYILVTPLQMASFISSIANGGELLRPWVVKKITDGRGKVIKEFSPHRIRTIGLEKRWLKLLWISLREVVRSGTGWRAENEVVKIAGKTGTVQLPQEGKTHNWFVGYAPYFHPRISIVVVIEEKEEKIALAPQIAGKILSRIFSRPLLIVWSLKEGKEK